METERRERVVVVGGLRTPFVKAGTTLRQLGPVALSARVVQGLIDRYALDPELIDELIWGRVLHDPRLSNLARELVFHLKLPAAIRADLVSNNCITSLVGLRLVADGIRQGRTRIGIAGGVESMSNPPILFGQEASRIFLDLAGARSTGERLQQLLRLRPRHFRPRPLSFAEPSTGLTMGQHAELTAQQWGVSRKEQDRIAFASHRNAAAAAADGRLGEQIVPLAGVERDGLIRADTSLEKLATLPPVFDRSERGTLSAGNSSPLTDGAAGVLLMAESAAEQHGYEPLAVVRALEFAAIDPGDGLLMAPAVAVPRLLQRTGLTLEQMELVEIHEAFAAQVACNLRAWEQGWREPAIGSVPLERLNVAGGSIAIGHPFAATGARIVLNLAQEMKRRQARYGLISICAAGAMAGAAILERP